ncbi:ankyrin repeat-containing domain protein [Suillus fuscotomentosus]|uniref:Ankyrin repeat-containing domain protein n=1 Tax=Suillus fuscotomentosus TaxID=1912939 RepID=A0AAD4E7U3_9AGAM|nr:ankyrin repeat-containing domain protein [Suillus fuscotomentosus]KAG1900962.1 ankyrin repeat-containing domain protein [Suillus fuscotomentosus]
MATWPLPTDDDKENLLLSCRYDDLDDVQGFVTKFGSDALSSVRDDNGNTVLHMTCGNGHIDVLDYLLPLVSPSVLSAQNSAGSTALHWAALNQHLEVAQKLVQFTGADLIDIKNTAGRSPLGEAEMIGWDEGARWLVQEMKLDETSQHDVNDNEEDGPMAMDAAQDIEVEIQDADGQVAKMTISGGATT